MTQTPEQNGNGKPGAPIGNQHAVKGAKVREAFTKALAGIGKGDADEGLRKICDRVVRLAEKGEQWAAQEVFNRIGGRVATAVELTGANGGDVVVRDANTSMGVARRVAYVLAMGAMAANDGTKNGGDKAASG